ncbi:hypothetical protein [Glycomyces arizonensis]|uniref:hypothetical protein n=1 Tax=Glycomyces arizonensis TaxID=256035 RepID=UPI00041C76C7|nr:hypothetical protein [Glycomyces arizonensis]
MIDSSATVDLGEGAADAGTLRVEVLKPRKRGRIVDLDPPSDGPEVTVMPLLSVNGRAVAWERSAAVVGLPAGPNLVEVMDDHVYESRTVEIRAAAESELFIGVDGMRGITRLLLGSRTYAESARIARLSPGVKAFGAALASTMLLPIAVGLPAGLVLPDSSVLGEALVYAAFAVGIASFFPWRRRFRRHPNGKPSRIQDVPPPEPIPSAGRARLLPPGSPPPAGSGLLVRFAPDTAAVQQLLVTVRTTGSTPGMVPYYSNGFEDWLAAPEITVDGEALPSRWGTWLIPLDPGLHTVRVRLPGFADPRHPATAPAGPPSEQTIRLQVAPGKVHTLDCRYNIVRLAAERLARDPSTESAWQHVLRSVNRLEEAERVASAPPLTITADDP